jgi:uncharacterized surface protein with fasciclin (FAS1) repeats
VRHHRTAVVGLTAALTLALAACSSGSDSSTTTTTSATAAAPSASASPSTSASASTAGSTVVGIASANSDFSTLVSAVKAAGLVDTLNGTGPFTVFAPTDAAFAALPAGVLDKLLMPENKATLTKILTYHVLPTEVKAADVTAGNVTTVEGSPLAITTAGGVKVGGATVTKTDIDASNGVIHVIDKVLVPPGVDVAGL